MISIVSRATPMGCGARDVLSEDTIRFVSRTMSGDFVQFSSVVHGYRVYRSVWAPVLGELLNTEQEHRNY